MNISDHMTYEQIEHTADVGIHATGDDLEEAFEEAARGLFSIITDIDKVEKVGEYKVQVKADDWEALLVDFLSELVYLFEVKSVLFSDFKISLSEEDGEKVLVCEAFGETMDLDKHEMDTAVKAVSYHEIEVDVKGEVRVIFDV